MHTESPMISNSHHSSNKNSSSLSLQRKKTYGSTGSNLSTRSSPHSVQLKPSDTMTIDDNKHYAAVNRASSDDNKKMIKMAKINTRSNKNIGKLDKTLKDQTFQKQNECKQQSNDILGLLSLNIFSESMDDEQSAERICLKENGFIRKNKICDTLQGELFEAEYINNNNKNNSQRIVIKKTDKNLYNKRIAIQQGMSIVVEEDIIKEAIILHHLTVDNKPISDYIAKFVKFFESDDAFYIVMENAGNTNLADFNEKAHQYIAEKKLKLKCWKKIVKYLFWQIAVIVYWLHHDMNCCHLDLNLSNIVLLNGNFIENMDGSVSIDPNIKIKLVDFGLSEIFKSDIIEKGLSDSLQEQLNIMDDNKDGSASSDDDDDEEDEYKDNPFKCNKNGITDKHYLSAPRVFNENVYDARKADIWSMGIILYELATGLEPYKSPNVKDESFHKVKHQRLVELLTVHDRTKNVNQKMVQLMCNMLNVRENERFNSKDVIKDEWLNLYYAKYKAQIIKKSHLQMARNKKLIKKMSIFPYYGCSD